MSDTSTSKSSGPAKSGTQPAAKSATRSRTVTNSAERRARTQAKLRVERHQSVRQAGRLAFLSLMIVLGLVGFAVNTLWVVVIVLMAAQWVHMATKFRGSRSSRSAASDMASAVGDEFRDFADGASAVFSNSTGRNGATDR